MVTELEAAEVIQGKTTIIKDLRCPLELTRIIFGSTSRLTEGGEEIIILGFAGFFLPV